MPEFVTGLLAGVAIGSVGFWVMLVVASLILIGFIEFENPVGTSMTVIILLVVLNALGVQVLKYVLEHPYNTAGYTLAYIVSGAIWAIFKWWRYVANIAALYEEEKKRYISYNGISGSVIPESKMPAWVDHVKSIYGIRNKVKISSKGITPPDPSDNKGPIYNWILFWPWSGIWYMFDEPVRKILKGIYNSIHGSLVRISEQAFKNANADFESARDRSRIPSPEEPL